MSCTYEQLFLLFLLSKYAIPGFHTLSGAFALCSEGFVVIQLFLFIPEQFVRKVGLVRVVACDGEAK